MTTPHPTDDVLVRFVLRRLRTDDDTCEPNHVAHCDRCNRRIEELSKEGVIEQTRVAMEMRDNADAIAENSRLLYERATEATREAGRLRGQRDAPLKALKRLESLHSRPGEGPNERFERIAEAFQRDTGYLRPGKDEAAASGGSRKGEREAAWEAWIEGICGQARAVVAKVETEL